jgi:hypothetical protein
MALTKDFRDTIRGRAQQEPASPNIAARRA